MCKGIGMEPPKKEEKRKGLAFTMYSDDSGSVQETEVGVMIASAHLQREREREAGQKIFSDSFRGYEFFKSFKIFRILLNGTTI